MGLGNDIATWFTGRNGVYRDSDKVDAAMENLNNIKNSTIETSKETIAEAVNKINACTGFEQYVGHVEGSAFDPVIDYAGLAVDEVMNQIQAKVDNINEYDSAKWYEKVGGTVGMVFAKVGEGFVGAFEDIGDAALTVGAWISKPIDAISNAATGGNGTHISDAIQKFEARDLSHELFDAVYYSTDLAKYSAITEDSGAASIARGVGQAVGYMTMGGYLSGANKALGAAGKMGKAATILSSTTNANTLVAAVGGLGSGTEAGLQNGLGLGLATLEGIKEGAIQGGMAYAAGKWGEHQQIKGIEQRADDMLNGKYSQEFVDNWKGQEIAKVRAQGGYTDKLTRTMQNKGFNDTNIVLNELAGQAGKGSNAFTQGLRNAGAVLKGEGKIALKDAGTVAKAAKNTVTSIPKAIVHPIKTVTGLGKGAKGAVDDVTRVSGDDLVGGKHTLGKTAYSTEVNIVNGAGKVVNPYSIVGDIAAGSTSYIGMNALKDPVADAGQTALTKAGVDPNVAKNIFTNENEQGSDYQRKIDTEKALTPVEEPTEPAPFQPKDDGEHKGGEEEPKEEEPKKEDPGDTTPTDPGPSGPTGPSGPGDSDDPSGTPQYRDTENPTTPDVTTPTETPVETPVETPTETPVETPVETPTETPVETPVETPIETPVETPTETPQPTPGAVVDDPGDTGGGTIIHTGGGYSGGNTYTATDPVGTDGVTDGIEDIDGLLDGTEDSIDDIIKKGSNYTKIPSSSTAIKSKSSSGSAIIPIAAGLTAAAAAGIGAKAYLDRKNNNDVGDDDVYGDEWDGDENLEIDYGTSGEDQYLDDDEYGYQATENNESYSARTNDELADIQ